MFTGFECRHAELEVRADRSCNRYCIDLGVAHQVLPVSRGRDCRIAALYALELLRIEIGDGRNSRPGKLCEIPHQIRTPVTVADDADLEHFCVPFDSKDRGAHAAYRR